MHRAPAILKQYFGYDAFRAGQEELIDAQLAGRDVFGIMPTGGGKSLCYQIPALLSEGITLVVSPLISLMKDQVAALGRAGIAAAYINSSLTAAQIRTVYRNLLGGQYKLVYIAPERLLTEEFLQTIRRVRVAILAVDEAHCISQWGQDFRPSYLRIVDFLNALDTRPVVSAFTATATPRVREDVERTLGLRDPLRIVTGFDRPNLHFAVQKPRSKPAALLQLVRERAGSSGIVYCATRREVEKAGQMLREAGIAATIYHAGLSAEERRDHQDDFINDRCPVIVATNAFGMGIDKSNVAYVIHYNMPQSVEAYYQEAGRAGRDGSAAECILLYSAGDIRTAKFLIEHSSADEEIPEERRARIVEQELARLDKMVAYCKTTRCLRAYLLGYFGEEHARACGNCGNCGAITSEREVTTQAKMILSCARRIRTHVGYPLGATVLVRVLRGSRDRRILSLGLDGISTYGLMASVPRAEVRELVECLEAEGYLHTGGSGAIDLTEKAAGVLFHDEPVFITVRAAAAVTPARVPNAPEEERLLARLKALRLRIAAEEKVPAYVVFSNATLQDMAKKKPATADEMQTVSGVGAYKAARYGARFLAEIAREED